MSSPRRPVVLCRALLVVVVLGTAGGVLSACGGSGGSDGSSGASDAPMPTGALAKDREILTGRRLYSTYCSSCHGASGGGGVGPKFTDGRLLTDFPTVEEQVTFVTNGKGAMPAWGKTMSAAELRAVVRYERAVLSKQGK